MSFFRNPAVIITLILLVVVLFGSKRLPDVARSVGSSLKIFKKEVKELRDDDDDTPRQSTSEPAANSTGTTPGTSTTATGSPTSTASASEHSSGSGEPRNT